MLVTAHSQAMYLEVHAWSGVWCCCDWTIGDARPWIERSHVSRASFDENILKHRAQQVQPEMHGFLIA
jgi:hypothetical protein